jgi:predicted TIM-barrel fold metal-dependent hydrolase
MTSKGLTLGYRVVDADNHYYEPYDCFTRHIERRYSSEAVRVIPGSDGLGRVYFGEKPARFMRVMQTDYIGSPGSLQTFFTDGAAGVERDIINGHDYPELMEYAARVKLLDEQQVKAAIMLPTFLDGIENDMVGDLEVFYANQRSYNHWVEEDWGYGADGRVFGAAWMSLLDLNLAIPELERAIAAGARIIRLRPGPLWGRSPADPRFDPFWARVEEANLLVVFHICGDNGYNTHITTHWGESAHPAMQFQTRLQWYLGSPERIISDTLAALVLHNLFGRFPRLRVLSVENGSSWLPALAKAIDKAAMMGFGRDKSDFEIGGRLTDRPSDVLREHVWVAPFFEDDPAGAIEVLGVRHVLFGSDYPHPEGLRHPIDFVKSLSQLSDVDKKLVMHDNTAELLGLVE